MIKKTKFDNPIPYKTISNGQYEIDLGGKPIALNVTIESSMPVTLMISGMDADPRHPNTKFFNRKKINYRGIDNIYIPMPLTPYNLSIKVWNEKSGQNDGIRILDICEAELQTGLITIAKSEAQYNYLKSYIDFAKEFALIAGYAPLQHYYSPDEKFNITYVDVIRDEISGQPKRTPAIIYRKSGWIRIASSRFRKMSIPMRIIVLYHEFFHHLWDSSDETLMDMSALNVFLAEGFPKSEGLYAFTNVFSDYAPLKERAVKNEKYISNYDYDKQSANIKKYVEGFIYQ